MCAGTVVDPPGPTSAAMVSVTSRSRSVAFRLSFERSARISTLARIGMVLRRSTTRCTWPSDFNNSERSTVTFIAKSVRRRVTKVARRSRFRQGRSAVRPAFPCVSFRQPTRRGRLFPRMARQAAERRARWPSWGSLQSCSWRLSASISSAKALSLPASASILRTACSTVVWSRPPNRRPISGSERSVRTFARYIAT